MTVRAGREFLAIPGPTTMPDAVLQAMHRPAIDIYSKQMTDLTESLLRDISNLFATKGKSYIYIANGHGAWEAALSNVLSRGDKVLVLESGRFAIGWGHAAKLMGAEVEVLKGDRRRAGASVVRAAPGDRPVARRRPGERLPPPQPARRSHATRGWRMVGRPGARLQHRRSQRALQHRHHRDHEQRP